MIWKNSFEKIEKAFDFKLYDWQKDYISMKIDSLPIGGRCTGKTFAFVIRQLLNYETRHVFPTIKMDLYNYIVCDRNNPAEYVHDWFPNYVREINMKLNAIGLETMFYESKKN